MNDLPPLLEIRFDFEVFWEYLWSDAVRQGAINTLYISALAQIIGIVLGIVAAVSRSLKIPVASQIAGLYIWFFRGTPLLVQLIFWFAALPQLAPDDFSVGLFTVQHDWFLLSPFMAALIGLSTNEGAYMSEIVRAGIQSVEQGQMDAAKSIGMTRMQAMRLVVLPQSVRVIVPPTGNEFIAMLKNSSLANVIAYPELLYESQRVYTRNFRVLELLAVASVYYLFFTTVFSLLQAQLEAWLQPDKHRDERGGWRGIVDRLRVPERMFGGGDRR